MLQKLSIKNYAIIDELELDLSQHLNIITGETGAGKSIMLGALSLILGKRADHSVLYNTERKCVVEGTIDISKLEMQSWFEQQELDYEIYCVIRREINAAGKSRAFINDTPVTLNVLKELSDQLIDLHAQHETLEVNDAQFRFNVLDAIAGQLHNVKDYQRRYKELRKKKEQLSQLLSNKEKQTSDLDYWQFQLTELSEASLQEGELEKLQADVKRLEHLETINESIQIASNSLDGEQGALYYVEQALQAIRQGSKYEESLEGLSKRVESLEIELRDLAQEISHYRIEESASGGSVNEKIRRLDQLQRLMMKHQAQTESDLINTLNDIQSRITDVDEVDEKIEVLESIIAKELTDIEGLASKLSQARRQVAQDFQVKVTDMLEDVGMPGASFMVAQDESPALNSYGMDDVQFLFSANKGSALQGLKKVASGGELSRLMLCIKSLVAGSMSLPSLVFDEIDSGISGETAVKVGELLNKLAKDHQIICITHLPQIAGKGEKHYFVYKEESNERTITAIRELQGDERVIEVAKMISGAQPTEAALMNARELLLN